MNKKFLLLVLLIGLFFSAEKAFAGTSQWDLSLQVPFYAGMKLGDDFISFRSAESYESLNPGRFLMGFLFLLPEIKWHYYLNLGPHFKLGAGLQLWTLIIESAMFPRLSLQFETGKFVFQGGFGGGLFFVFGLYNGVVAGTVFVPELSAAYKFGEFFRMGLGVTTIHSPQVNGFFGSRKDDFLLLASLFARWTL